MQRDRRALNTHRNTKESGPVMATCSPRVGIMLAGLRQACFRRHIEYPPQARPARAME
jgi:hypothetical protein